MVVMIIAILVAIAATRMGRMVGQAEANATAANVHEVQKAIECYAGEHGARPAAATLGPQLTQSTDTAGNVSTAQTTQFRFGPYLKTPPPTFPGPQAGTVRLWKPSPAAGWMYDEAAGELRKTP